MSLSVSRALIEFPNREKFSLPCIFKYPLKLTQSD